MTELIKLNKIVYDKTIYPNVVDINFSQLLILALCSWAYLCIESKKRNEKSI